MLTLQESIALVKSKIHWVRKWTKDLPNYLHSLRVNEQLKKYDFDEDIQIAWLLHDIIEDSLNDQNWEEIIWVTFDDLRKLWYSENIVNIVDLSTHNLLIEGSFEKWKNMLERLIKEENVGAWAVKLADISDNLTECHLMPNRDKLDRFLNKKCPIFVYYGNKYFAWTEFYNEFLERYYKQVRMFNEYFS